MWKLIFVAVLVTYVGANDKMISKGRWRIIAIEKCEDSESYDFQFDVSKHKKSRTQEVFDGTAYLPCDLDESFALQANVSKYSEGGGYKNYQCVSDNCLLCFLNKYAEQNIKNLLVLMNLETFSQGEHTVSEFTVEYCEFPEEGILGEFKADVFIIDKTSKIVGCVVLYVSFTEERDECEIEER